MNRPRIGAAGALALLVGLTLTTAVPGAIRSTRADAAGLHRAGVVVDPGDGSGPHTACVWFGEESISGLELLARSSFDAGVRAFGGLGGAVCSIDGSGCSTDSACLSCGGAQYWAYATANPGDTTFAQAPAGAGSRTVTDGGVDGWRWGSGDPPAFLAIDRICPASPPAPAPTPRPAPSAPAPPAPAPVAPAGPQAPLLPNDLPPQQPARPAAPATTAVPSTSTRSSVVPSSTAASSTTTSTTSASTSSTTATTIDSDADPAATVASAAIVAEAENDDTGGGASVLGIVAVLLAGGLGATAVWRIRRSG